MEISYNKTATRILDVAEQFTQTLGFNGFSYKDIQAEVGVKTSSIHYYFPTKQNLALALVQRYSQRFQEAMANLDRDEANAMARLAAFGGIFVEVARANRFCLCGMLASDALSMPEAAMVEIRLFFEQLETWLAKTIAHGKANGEIPGSVEETAAAANFLASLEGGMLIARTRSDVVYLESVLDGALGYLSK